MAIRANRSDMKIGISIYAKLKNILDILVFSFNITCLLRIVAQAKYNISWDRPFKGNNRDGHSIGPRMEPDRDNIDILTSADWFNKNLLRYDQFKTKVVVT